MLNTYLPLTVKICKIKKKKQQKDILKLREYFTKNSRHGIIWDNQVNVSTQKTFPSNILLPILNPSWTESLVGFRRLNFLRQTLSDYLTVVGETTTHKYIGQNHLALLHTLIDHSISHLRYILSDKNTKGLSLCQINSFNLGELLEEEKFLDSKPSLLHRNQTRPTMKMEKILCSVAKN